MPVITEEIVEAETFGRQPVCLSPWRENLYGLVSLLDMLRFYAEDFCYASSILGQIYQQLQSKMPRESSWQAAIDGLRSVEQHCKNLELNVTLLQIDRIKAIIEQHEPANPEEFAKFGRELMEVSTRLHDELKSRLFFSISSEQTRFYETTGSPLFSTEVKNAFNSASDDIREAGDCLALGRNTACVFHLMRVLEIGLTALGSVFGVSLAHTNWAPAIDQIESKIREMHKDPIWKALPNCKELQERYAQAASYFGIFKDAWRNYTAHARGSYNAQEATDIMTSVRAFMQKLVASGLHE